MSDLHLISHSLCPYVQRSVIILEEKNIAFRRTNIDLNSPPNWFFKLSPLGRVPILHVKNKKPLFESAVICEFLDEISPHSLHPADPYEKAHQRSWIEFGSTLLNDIAQLYSSKTQPNYNAALTHINEKLNLIEQQLEQPPYFSGKNFHIIDAVYGPIFRYFDVFETFTDLKVFTEKQKTIRWRKALRQRKSVQSAVNDNYCDTLLEFIKERKSYMSGLTKEEF